METVIIAAPGVYDDELKARLDAAWEVSDCSTGGWVVEDGGHRVYVSRNDAVANELEPAARARIAATMPLPVFYTVDFSDLDLCRRVLVSIADDPKLMVDNDHGGCWPGSEFVRVLRSQDGWDWRADASRADS